VFNEISLLTGFYWLEFYKYKIMSKLEIGMEKLARKNWHGKTGKENWHGKTGKEELA
jgi:hypothetical protein